LSVLPLFSLSSGVHITDHTIRPTTGIITQGGIAIIHHILLIDITGIFIAISILIIPITVPRTEIYTFPVTVTTMFAEAITPPGILTEHSPSAMMVTPTNMS
jgi:hypothetical protein